MCVGVGWGWLWIMALMYCPTSCSLLSSILPHSTLSPRLPYFSPLLSLPGFPSPNPLLPSPISSHTFSHRPIPPSPPPLTPSPPFSHPPLIQSSPILYTPTSSSTLLTPPRFSPFPLQPLLRSWCGGTGWSQLALPASAGGHATTEPLFWIQ